MPKLTKGDILHVAKLAKLNLSPEAVKKYLDQLSKVVDYISQLEEVDTSDTQPTSQTTGLISVYRTDEVRNEDCLSQEEALSGAASAHNGYFLVPGILEEKTDK